MGAPMILRIAFVTALLMALGGALSACGFSNTFNYGHGQGACENCAMSSEPPACSAQVRLGSGTSGSNPLCSSG
jgi:hypothetical protein